MGILLDILSGIGNTLDVPGSMVRDTLGGENPFDQLMSPWSAKNRLTGRDLLRRAGWAGQEDTWGNLAGGIGLELATDPLNIIPAAGLLKRAFQGHKIAKATRAVDAANDASMALRAKGWMPEEVAQATKIRQPDIPGRFEIRDATGKMRGTVFSEEEADLLVDQMNGYNKGHVKQMVSPPRSVNSPATVYHETAAPPFGSHEFMPDPGTNNWLGRGTYFAKEPGETAGTYSAWDKSGTIMPQGPGEFVPTSSPQAIIKAFRDALPEKYFKGMTPQLERELLPMKGSAILNNPDQFSPQMVESLTDRLRPLYRQNNPDPFDLTEFAPAAQAARAQQSAPRTMMSYVDSRKPFTFEEPATLQDMLMAARSAKDQPKQLESLFKQSDDMFAEMQTYLVNKKPIPQSLADNLNTVNQQISKIVDTDGGGILTPLAASRGAVTDMRSLRNLDTSGSYDGLAALAGATNKAGKRVPTKGELWALMQSHGKSPDEISDLLRAAGYDALQHEAGTGTAIQEAMYQIQRQAPNIDEHSELAAFFPSNIYEPFIAPALQARPDQLKRIPRSLKAAFAGYQAGVAPARGRSQE